MGKKNKTRLNPGDTICPKCQGTGKGKKWEAGGFDITPECPKCLGDGKFDWVERIMDKPRRLFPYLEQEIINKLSEEIREEIDKEILENIIGSYNKEEEQNIKEKEDEDDNGVFSEFLLHTIAKQKLKGKKD